MNNNRYYVNILQNMRINLDGIPLRSLALQLVQHGIDKYEKGL